MEKSGRKNIVGDNDPLDICVLTEREVTHGNIIVSAIPIGGFRMIDGGEADDKIIAVLRNDEMYSEWKDIAHLCRNDESHSLACLDRAMLAQVHRAPYLYSSV